MGRFDLSFKSLAGNWRALLRRFGTRHVDATARIEPVERELALPVMSVDQAFLIEQAGERWIEHFEAELVLSSGDLTAIAERALLLSLGKRAPVWTTSILLSRRHAPARGIPELFTGDYGCVQLSMRARVVALWEMQPEELLDDPDVNVLPVAGAMKASRRRWTA